MLKKWLRRKFRRKEWLANPADPTVVIQWRSKHLTLIGIWDVEANLYLYRWKFRFYGTKLFTWLYNILEDGYWKQQKFLFDEEIAEAELKAGWDPNP